ncbi:ribonuclease H1 [Amyelois transitella]|uniref:ribonuclease H1 n=1 Tax=Amyelois transitella TaxID=680683 RepID=UPI0029902243|nr:ribonuclease H1 [Amyelois transitella]
MPAWLWVGISVFQKVSAVFKILKNKRMPFYAVAKGRIPGIFMNWPDCEAQVKGFPGARYKKFDSAANAQNFIETEGGSGGNKPATKGKKSNPYPPVPEATTNNLNVLKRPFSSSAIVQKSHQSGKSSKKKSKRASNSSDQESDTFTDEDDLNTILVKQLDDVEKRLKGFEKGVDKILKKSKPGRKAILIDPPGSEKQKSGNHEFTMDRNGRAQVYTDGACSSNGREGARAGIGVYWGPGHPLNVSEPVSGRATNNSGEIQAATRAMQQAAENGVTKLTINTDSKFLIDSATKWMPGWKQNGWTLKSGGPVKNQSDFRELDRAQSNLDVEWRYVEAHQGIHGNEMADQLAKEGASRYQGNSRQGNNSRYGNNSFDDY